MKSISNAVEDIIKQSPILEELLSLNIINLSAYAREIKPAVEEITFKDTSEAAIVMALKRLVNQQKDSGNSFPLKFKTKPELILRSNLFEITVKNSPTILEKQQKLVAFANRQQSYFTTFSYGLLETTTIAGKQIKNMALSLYKNEEIVSTFEDVAIITINFQADITDIPFVYYTILRTLAWSSISIIEIISTYSELTIVLKNNDIELAFSVIKKIFSK